MSQERTLGKSMLSPSLQFIVYTPQFQFLCPCLLGPLLHSALYVLENKNKKYASSCIQLLRFALQREPAASVNTVWKSRHPVYLWVCGGYKQGQELRKSHCRASVSSSPAVFTMPSLIILISLIP